MRDAVKQFRFQCFYFCEKFIFKFRILKKFQFKVNIKENTIIIILSLFQE
jgi:hypothetical protein